MNTIENYHFEKGTIFLVWPAPFRPALLPFYFDFLHLLTLREKCVLLVHDVQFISMIRSAIARPLLDRLIILRVHSLQDIWIRDWAPVQLKSNIAFDYQPNYLTPSASAKTLVSRNRFFRRIKGLKLNEVSYRADGGSIVYNGRDSIITTKRLLKDNGLTEKYLRNIFKDEFNIKNTIILSEEPGDITGHVDGIVRFIDDKYIIVGDYPVTYKEGKQYMDRVYSIITKSFPNSSILRVVNSYPFADKSKFPSARGNYINFLKSGKNIYVPLYGIPSDKKALEVFRSIRGYNVIPVDIDGVNHLAGSGGVLNCISWILPSK